MGLGLGLGLGAWAWVWVAVWVAVRANLGQPAVDGRDGEVEGDLAVSVDEVVVHRALGLVRVRGRVRGRAQGLGLGLELKG